MHVWLIIKLLVLLSVANTSPIILKKFAGERFCQPIDGGLRLPDGQPLFGPSKTVRGIVIAMLATPAAALALDIAWWMGALVGAAAMAGDLLSSFVKRRLKLASSSQASGLDQIPESLLPTLLASWFLPITAWDIAAIVGFFLVGEMVFAWIFFKIGLRDRPY